MWNVNIQLSCHSVSIELTIPIDYYIAIGTTILNKWIIFHTIFFIMPFSIAGNQLVKLLSWLLYLNKCRITFCNMNCVIKFFICFYPGNPFQLLLSNKPILLSNKAIHRRMCGKLARDELPPLFHTMVNAGIIKVWFIITINNSHESCIIVCLIVLNQEVKTN